MAQNPRVELYVRSLAPTDIRDRQESVIERLAELDESDRIKAFDVVLCGDCVCSSAATAKTDIGQQLLDRYERFEQWAQESDRTLAGFTEQATSSAMLETTVTGISFPRLALAEYRGGELAYVAPSRNGTEHTTVLDRIKQY
jgi:hypothetical protein